MSRFRKFAHSLLSGYVLLGANILFTLASVPLALKYLSKPEFGLWTLVTSMAGYIALVDFGMSGSVARILIDYKDRHAGGEYGSLIQTGALVGVAQGALVFLGGIALALAAAPLLHVPSEMERDFVWLMIGQCGLLGASFATRIFSHLLAAHQRYDVTNYASTALFAVNYAVMWFCFARGLGVFSILWAQAAGTVLSIAVSWLGCVGLRLFPSRAEWGRPTWIRFHELFAFGRDIFVYSLGSQLINASQPILLTRLLGLETATLWNICTRAYIVVLQVIYRIFDFSCAALAEMMVQGERKRLFNRFKEIVILSTSLSVAVGVVFAINNGPFVQLWTSGKISWRPINDLLLALWLVICVSVHAHIGLVGQTKSFKFSRFIFFFEGLTFVGLTILLYKFGGVTAMLLASIGCSLAFSFPYGLRRTKKYFGLSWAELADWHRAPVRLALWLAPAALVVWAITHSLPLWTQLVANGGLMGILAAWMFLRLGLVGSLQAEVMRRSPVWARPLLVRAIGAKAAAAV